jgi:hypothetical protein
MALAIVQQTALLTAGTIREESHAEYRIEAAAVPWPGFAQLPHEGGSLITWIRN